MSHQPVIKRDGTTVFFADCRDVLAEMPDNSIDAVVTDPPYDLTSSRAGGGANRGFMGNAWDATGIAFDSTFWQEVLRVMKPGAHLLAFGAPRTYHRLAVAIEDAGFELKDTIMWINSSSFPKSHNIAKSLTKAGEDGVASRYEGWGSALKPCHEPITVARKPCEGSLTRNVLAYGTGGLNIDATRIHTHGENFDNVHGQPVAKLATQREGETDEDWRDRIENAPARLEALEKLKSLGRWPANIVFSHADGCVQVGTRTVKGRAINRFTDGAKVFGGGAGHAYSSEQMPDDVVPVFECVVGCPIAALEEQHEGASRFYKVFEPGDQPPFRYVAKASPREKPRVNGLAHPTTKPLSLLTYLLDLVVPPNGVVLDPFAGSGTTLEAAVLRGFDSIGIEMTEEYIPLIEFRLDRAMR